MQFIAHPIGHDLVVSAILAILLPDETRDPVLLGVLPTGKNTSLLIVCQVPCSQGKVSLFNSLPHTPHVDPGPWMSE